MHRRTHKKSKNGCFECKRRHMKCDERRPSCVNCTTSERSCSYLDVVRSSSAPSVTSPVGSPSMNHASPSLAFSNSPANSNDRSQLMPSTTPSVIANSTSERTSSPQYASQGGVDMQHLELLYHAMTETSRCFGAGERHSETLFLSIMPSALAAPFLMHEVLAIAALHLSTLRPTQKGQYEYAAAELHTSALSLFNQTFQHITTENCLPMFLFSSLLGKHVLFTTVTRYDSNSRTFLEDFIGYLQLHRGVRAVTTNNWELLRETAAKAINVDETNPLPPVGEAHGPECELLRRLLNTADMSSASIKTCQQAIDHLQWTFDAQRGRSAAGLIFAWPIQIPVEYLELLKQRRPEALAILAHYAVLLHSHREIWIVGNAGRYLIESITRYLGTYWENWLAWPNDVLVVSPTPAEWSYGS